MLYSNAIGLSTPHRYHSVSVETVQIPSETLAEFTKALNSIVKSNQDAALATGTAKFKEKRDADKAGTSFLLFNEVLFIYFLIVNYGAGNAYAFAYVFLIIYYVIVAFSVWAALPEETSNWFRAVAVVVVLGNLPFQAVDESTIFVRIWNWLFPQKK